MNINEIFANIVLRECCQQKCLVDYKGQREMVGLIRVNKTATVAQSHSLQTC